MQKLESENGCIILAWHFFSSFSMAMELVGAVDREWIGGTGHTENESSICDADCYLLRLNLQGC